MAFPALLSVIRNFEANPIRILEEGRAVVDCVVGIQPRFRCLDAEGTELVRHCVNIRDGIDAQTEVVETRGVGVRLRRTRETASARSRSAD